VIVDGRKPHSILFEIFSDKGAGTLIRKWKI
jgi:acetylglutamate kinase